MTQPQLLPTITPTAQAGARETADQFIHHLCNFDVDQAAAELCEDVRLSIGGESWAVGKTRVRNALIRALASLYSVRCEPAVVWIKRNVAVIEADVNCERSDCARIAFPLTLVIRFREHLISDLQLLTYEPAVVGFFPALRRG